MGGKESKAVVESMTLGDKSMTPHKARNILLRRITRSKTKGRHPPNLL